MSDQALNKPYRDYATYLQDQYGGKVYRVPVDLDLGCPNHADGSGRCTYCGDHGSRAAHLAPSLPLHEQVAKGVKLARERYGANILMAFFQAFTSTNAPVATLRELYSAVLDCADFAGIIVSTRPDCLPEDVLDYLGELAATYDVCVELGVQSANDATLKRVNRGHTFDAVASAAIALAARGIRVAAHIILGLPGETLEDYRRTASALTALPFSALKIHNLHVVKGTALADQWQHGTVHTMDEHEYGEVLMDFLRRIPASWPIMRMTSDTPREWLLAPKWWMTKGQFLQYIERQMRLSNWQQGDLVGKRQVTPRPPAEGGIAGDTRIIPRSAIKRLSNVPRAQRFFEAFRMPKGFEDGGLAVVDFGFGLGDLTSGIPRVVARQVSSPVRIAAVTLTDTDLEHVAERWPQLAPILETVRASGEGEFDWGDFFLCWGDVRQHLYRLRGRADLILLEPPDVHQHPQFFSLEFLRRSLRMLQPGGVLVANSGSAALRGALIRLGATVGAVPGLNASQGTVASMDRNAIPEPLDEQTTGIITKTLSGTPFRDRDLRWTRKQILQHRDEVLRRLRLRGWKKRLDAGDQEQESQ